MIFTNGFHLSGQGVLGEDRLDRALRLAGSAVDALLRIDDQHPLELVDAVHRADVDAGPSLMSMQGSLMMYVIRSETTSALATRAL